MKRLTVAASLALLVPLGSQAAQVTINQTGWSLTYDDSSAFGSVVSSSGGSGPVGQFSWNFPSSFFAMVAGNGTLTQALSQNSLSLPTFTLTAAQGYQLSGLSFTMGATASVLTGANSAGTAAMNILGRTDVGGQVIAGGSAVQVSANTSLGTNFTATGAFINPSTQYGAITLQSGTVELSAISVGTGFASVVARAEKGPTFQFNVSPVPEPAEWALMVAGLGVVGWAGRRQRRFGTSVPTAAA